MSPQNVSAFTWQCPFIIMLDWSLILPFLNLDSTICTLGPIPPRHQAGYEYAETLISQWVERKIHRCIHATTCRPLRRSDQFDFTVSNLSIGYPHKSPFIRLPWSILSNRIKTQKCNQRKPFFPGWTDHRSPHLPKQLLVTQKAVTTRQSRQIVSGPGARRDRISRKLRCETWWGRQLGIVKIALHSGGHFFLGPTYFSIRDNWYDETKCPTLHN